MYITIGAKFAERRRSGGVGQAGSCCLRASRILNRQPHRQRPRLGSIAPAAPAASGTAMTDELGDPVNTFEITNFNNFYGLPPTRRRLLAWRRLPDPAVDRRDRWSGQQSGHLQHRDIPSPLRPGRAHLSVALRGKGWSMVIPWLGFQLSTLLELVEPKNSTQYIALRDAAGSRGNARPAQQLVQTGHTLKVCRSTKR